MFVAVVVRTAFSLSIDGKALASGARGKVFNRCGRHDAVSLNAAARASVAMAMAMAMAPVMALVVRFGVVWRFLFRPGQTFCVDCLSIAKQHGHSGVECGRSAGGAH